MNGAPLAVKKPLTMRLLRRILFFSGAFILLLASGRAWWEYRTALDAVQEEFAIIESAKAKSVAASLWDFNQEQLLLHVEGIRHFPHISYAAVRDATNVVAQSGVSKASGVLNREYPLFVVYKGQRQNVGVLQVQAGLQKLREHAFERALQGLAFNSALVLLVAGLLFWLTRGMVSRHLAALAAHFQSFSLGGENAPLVLDKKPAGDELDVLAQAVNTMQEGLAASYAQALAAQAEARSMARFPQENPSPVLRASAEGVLLKANPASEKLLGPLGVREGMRLPDEYAVVVARAAASGQVQHFEGVFGGRVFAFAASPVPEEGFVNLYGLDISRRVQAEEELRESEERIRALFNATSDSAILMDTEGDILDINVRGAKRRGLSPQAMTAQSIYDHLPPKAAESRRLEIEEAVRTRRPRDFEEEREGRFYAITLYPIPDGAAVPRQLASFSRDITERKRAEEELRRSLHEKEILLKEIHHRVKNNLQIISSLLFLQAEYIIEPQDKAMFEESQKRISAMALVHEELYGSGDLSSVGMADYVPRLVERVMASSDVSVRLFFDVEDVRLPVTQSIPCGLALNEMVMNAVKHAFRSGQEGQLCVSLTRRDGQMELAVADNGPGLPQGFSLESPTTLGLTLITSLARQLGGSVAAQNQETGARFALRFPVEKP